MHLVTRPPRPVRRRHSSSASVLLAVFALLAVVLAAGSAGGQSTGTAADRVTLGERPVRLAAEPAPAPADGYRTVDAARRTPTVPVAVLAASVVLAGWALGRRFVPPARPPVRSWTARRNGGNRAPPPLAV